MFRPPAVPLVTHSPYFSIWSMSDTLNGDWPRHWTGSPHGMCGFVRFGDRVYRWLGNATHLGEHMPQVSLEVTATASIYRFAADGNEMTVTFRSPVLVEDLDLVSRPVTYLSVETNRPATVYVDLAAEVAVDKPNQEVTGGSFRLGDLRGAFVRKAVPEPLRRSGDDLRIEWGTAYLAGQGQSAIVLSDAARGEFVKTGKLPDSDCLDFPRRAEDAWPAAAAISEGTRHEFLLAYDEEFAYEFFGRRLRPLWREFHPDAASLLKTAWSERAEVTRRAIACDTEVIQAAKAKGGDEYAQIASLAYRQAVAAHGFARDMSGMLLMLSKENFSNGCIGTVDVTYPSAPLFLWKNPELVRAMVEPILFYAASPRWKFDFAPHDLGQYPLANGQVYGGGERTEENQMPVEECGNMLILVSAYEAWSGKKDLFDDYAKVLATWADYLLKMGLDPENQLCTDDFAGHLAHNANLSVKAILGLAAYARQLKSRDAARAEQITAKSKIMAQAWKSMAEDGTHTRLTFDQSGTWSQKYNLVWDTLLNLHVFDPQIAVRELNSYPARQNAFGLPLDSRADYTKLDWIYWSASMATSPAQFRALTTPIYKFLNESPSRVPMTDWYDTKTGKVVGFRARSVVGGVFIPLLKPR